MTFANEIRTQLSVANHLVDGKGKLMGIARWNE
jgi:hypothetical protein